MRIKTRNSPTSPPVPKSRVQHPPGRIHRRENRISSSLSIAILHKLLNCYHYGYTIHSYRLSLSYFVFPGNISEEVHEQFSISRIQNSGGMRTSSNSLQAVRGRQLWRKVRHAVVRHGNEAGECTVVHFPFFQMIE